MGQIQPQNPLRNKKLTSRAVINRVRPAGCMVSNSAPRSSRLRLTSAPSGKKASTAGGLATNGWISGSRAQR